MATSQPFSSSSSHPPSFSDTENLTRATVGVTFQAPKGLDPVKAGAGDKFAVTGSNGSYQVKKE